MEWAVNILIFWGFASEVHEQFSWKNPVGPLSAISSQQCNSLDLLQVDVGVGYARARVEGAHEAVSEILGPLEEELLAAEVEGGEQPTEHPAYNRIDEWFSVHLSSDQLCSLYVCHRKT